MGHGGKRLGAGRRKGAHNRASARREQFIAQSGPAPIDVLIRAMRYYYSRAEAMIGGRSVPGPPVDTKNLTAEIDLAFDKASDHAAKAAKYIHPRISPMDYNSRFDMTRLTDDERRTLTRLLAKGLGLDDEPAANGSGGDPLRLEDIRDINNH